jgi:hypothetical protein
MGSVPLCVHFIDFTSFGQWQTLVQVPEILGLDGTVKDCGFDTVK